MWPVGRWPRPSAGGPHNVASITPVCLSTLPETTGVDFSRFSRNGFDRDCGQNLSLPLGWCAPSGVGHPRFGRPYGTWVIVARYPALKRGARFGRPSGAAR